MSMLHRLRIGPSLRALVPFTALVVTALLVAGCDSSDESTGPFYGPAAQIGDGTVRTYVRLDDAGVPTALGVVLTEGALTGLPDGDGHGGHNHDVNLTLRLPAEATGVPFDHVDFGWNPHGHEPEGLFTLPHFDVHFYTVPDAEKRTWTPADPEFAEKGMRAPAERYIPAGFIAPPGSAPVPMMGLHWLDAADPTYAPGGPAFSEVFLWGSYDGRVVFAEPMITLAFLQSGQQVDEALAQPAAFAQAGLYPTRYTVRHVSGRDEIEIELGGLVRRTAG